MLVIENKRFTRIGWMNSVPLILKTIKKQKISQYRNAREFKNN